MTAAQAGFVDPNVEGTVFQVLLQPDGKILIGGGFATVGGQPRSRVARLNADGSLDPTFQDPQILGPDQFNNSVYAMALQPDGKILIGGIINSVGGLPRAYMARLNSNGSVDPSFHAGLSSVVNAIAVQPDGKILVGGYFDSVHLQPMAKMARLNADGSLDTTFQNPQIASPAGYPVGAIALQPDGKVLVGGYFNTIGGQARSFGARLNANGTLDTGFALTLNGGPVEDFAVLPDGKIYAAGFFSSVNSTTRRVVVRVNADGSIDPSFQDPNISSGNVTEIDPAPDGKLVIGGNFSSVVGQAREDIARLNADGTLDATFLDPNTNFGGSFSSILDVEVQPDGKTLIGGQFSTIGHRPRKNLVRLLQNGTVEHAPGTSLVVTKTADTNDGTCNADCSLREAIAAANTNSEGTIINFDATVFESPQTITLSLGQLSLANGTLVTINGPGASLLTISGNDASRILLITRDVNATISGLTLANGNGVGPGFAAGSDGGAIFVEPNGVITSVSIANCVIRNNRATSGGAIRTFGTSSMTISNTTIADNTATYSPGVGGLIFDNGTLTITDSVISGNASTFQNGGGTGGLETGGSAFTITGTIIQNNTGYAAGGLGAGGTGTITDATIRNNQSTTGAGGMAVGSQAVVTLANSSISENTVTNTDGRGGGINTNGRLTIIDSTVRNNSAPFGGGIFSAGGLNADGLALIENTASAGGGLYNNVGGATGLPVSISRSLIDGNISTGFGGGVYNRDPLFVTGTSISNNTAAQNGGGVFNVFLTVGNAAFSATSSTFTGNTATAGGGVSNQSGTVTLTNSTVSRNTVSAVGGGIRTNSSGTVETVNSTIAFNHSNAVTGGVDNGAATVRARNTIISNNTVGTRFSPSDFTGTLESQGYNLLGTTTGTQITGVTTGNILDQAAQLDPVLRSNGGSTMTHRLLGGPAIDGADPANVLAADQRGVSRPLDGNADNVARADIGAFEVKSIRVANVNDNGTGSLRQAIAEAAATGDSIVFDFALFATPKTIVFAGGEIVIPQDATVSIIGPGADRLTLMGNGHTRLLSAQPRANVSLSGLSITGGNAAGAKGGAILNSTGSLLIVNCVIYGNTAEDGGGIYSGVNPNGGVFRAVDSIIRDNTATRDGGGAFVIGTENEFTGSHVLRNTASVSGGGVMSHVAGNLRFSNSVISENNGGGIQVGSGTTASVTGSTVSGNLGGAGIHNLAALTVQRSLISRNTNSQPGGGIYNQGSGPVSISNSTISRNRSTVHGGGFYNSSGTQADVTIESSTISFNHTNGVGGGVFNNIDDTIIVGNSIIANNTAAIQSPDFERTLTSEGFNLIENTTGTTIVGDTTGNILGQDPMLDPVLRANGGPTLTHALQLASPAIDKGRSLTPVLTSDQRGSFRPVDQPGVPNGAASNASDIGAYERALGDKTRTLFDYDGDGRSDLSVRRPANNIWYLQQSSAGYTGFTWGVAGDRMAPADYDGDGGTDIAVFRPSEGRWYIFMSQSQTFQTFNWGQDGDVPVPADRDGDGKADLIVHRPSNNNFYTRFANGSFNTFAFGTGGDKPVRGDFDADGVADIAVFRPSNSTWYILKSSVGFVTQTWGEAGDVPVPADYDGDGATDLAVYRPSSGQWYRSRSTAGFDVVNWGQAGDIAVPADFDGDGRADAAVFRPAEGRWYMNQSMAGFLVLQFGQNGDVPTQSAFTY